VPAIELAARRWSGVSWWVANADRALPFADASFDTALSIAGRRPAAELRRVLKPGGRLLVAVPGEDDLIELREAVLGEGRLLGREQKTVAELADYFKLESHRILRSVETVDARDALAATYRGARQSQRKEIGEMQVTLSSDLLSFKEQKPRPLARPGLFWSVSVALGSPFGAPSVILGGASYEDATSKP
jgi:23S rRNA (guanine745-N1)-methyltransferase